MSSTSLALLVILLPLASAALIALFLRRLGTLASLVSTAACAALAVAALMLSFGGHRFTDSMEWLRLDTFVLSLGIKFDDDLAALMLSIVAVVGLCVHVFSLGYMHDDESKARYFGGLSIFMFSMIGIVFADNLFMMFLFWELVGFSSYSLINHYFKRQQAADAAKKAFIVNRVGDFGFLLGIIWCYHALGTVNLSQIAQHTHGSAIAAGIPLLLFCGAVGKSAQLPLHVWLPDAMEGPTPVSALIHAATMVAAGIYMLCRIEPLFVAAPPVALQTVMWVGTLTALYAALCAITQSDIKKVLAYSTLSQLGYMVAAFGLGRISGEHGGTEHAVIAAGVGAAMFHLTTHAFFKALMFLGSGSVIHGCHHEQNIFKMGGLRSRMFVTFLTFTIGVLAIIGFPALAGFFSKDAILYLAFANNTPVFVILALTAVLTALYMVRLWIIVFFGKPQSDEASHAHESGIAMLLPLILLAVLSIAGGYVGIYGKAFTSVWSQIPHPDEHAHLTILITSIVVMVAGAGAALAFYRPGPSDRLQTASPGVFGLLNAVKESFDGIYNYYVAKIQQRFAMLMNGVEQIFLAGLVIRGLAGVVGLVGMGARALHVGSLHAYVYWFLLGVILVWGFASGTF